MYLYKVQIDFAKETQTTIAVELLCDKIVEGTGNSKSAIP